MRCYMLVFLLVLQNGDTRSQDTNATSHLIPKNFKTIMPLEINERGIVIPTYWGQNKIRVDLLWDNNSPTWANEGIIRDVTPVSKSKNYFYSTTTADGSGIKGNIYECNKISLGDITFLNIPFYEIDDPMQGAFGDNMISKGIWEINFKAKKIIFTSNMDSLEDLDQAQLLPANFANDVIKIPVHFRNNITENIDVDFGFDDFILLPEPDFIKIIKGNDKTYKRAMQFSTPAKTDTLINTYAFDTISIQDNKFKTVFCSNEKASEKLIGLRFFEQFDFVIFDYPNKLFYISKKE